MPEDERLQPVTARAHVPEKIDVRHRATRHALRWFEQDPLVVCKDHPVALKQQKNGRHQEENQGRLFVDGSLHGFTEP